MKGALSRRAGRASAAACLAMAFAAFCLPISNPDMYWHLSAARWMLLHKALPTADWLSTTMYGRPWTDFEWMTQLVWGLVGRFAGLGGLWALKACLLSVAGAWLWATLGLYGIPSAGRGIAVLAWALGLTSVNDLRPENFSTLLFLALLYALESRRLGRPSRAGAPARAAATALGFWLWAGLHAGFLYGLALMGVYAAVERLRHGKRELLLLTAIAFAAPLLNPYGVKVYLVPWEHLAWMRDLQTFIVEWQEPSLLNQRHWPFWGVLFASFGAVLGRYCRDRDVPYEHLAALALFGASAGGSARTGSYFLCVAVPAAARALRGLLPPRASRAAGAAALAACVALFALLVPRTLAFGLAVDGRYAPEGAAAFLAREKRLWGRRMYNPWHLGGYLGYRLNPLYRVFVDGRYIFHPWLRPIHEAGREPGAFGALLDRERIDVAVIEPAGAKVPETIGLKDGGKETLQRPLYLYFLPKERWAMVYWDPRSIVFVRRSAVEPAWLAAREYRHFRPDDLRAAYLKVAEGLVPYAEVAGEVDRFVRDAGPAEGSRSARSWLASLAAEARPAPRAPGRRSGGKTAIICPGP